MTDQPLIKAPQLAIVIPCYNEEEALPISIEVLLSLYDRMSEKGLIASTSYILCVNDGSKDGTWQTIVSLHEADARVKGINLAHNRGHQCALLAGLMTVVNHCDACISIDADLQDDPEAIIDMVKQYLSGKEIVYGVRSSRETDTFFKRTSAHAFYSLQRAMGLETVYDHADYRLMSNRALNLLAEYGESNVFLRGIVPMIGLDTSVTTYERNERVAGTSKYPFSKMLSLSIDGITSFSAKPMRWIFIIGFVSFLVTFIVTIYVLVSYFCSDEVNAGWASIMLSIWGVSSVIMMSIGIVGEYIGKIFTEVKGRPRFAIRDKIWD